nr:uncharacterized protein LOC126546278 isoform X2 [Dermacentor andersoni]
MSPRGLRASLHSALGDDAPGPIRGRGRPKKYATAEEARAARNAARRNRRREEDEAAAAARREQHAALMRRRRSGNAELVEREAAAARARRAAKLGSRSTERPSSSDSDVGPYSPVREVDELGSAAEGLDGSSLVGPSKATVTERPQSKGCQANLLSTGKSQKTASKGCQADFLSTEKPQKMVSRGCQTTGITRTQTQKTHADEIEQESRAAILQPEKHSGSRKRPMPQDASISRRASGPTTSSSACAYAPKRTRLSATDASTSR